MTDMEKRPEELREEAPEEAAGGGIVDWFTRTGETVLQWVASDKDYKSGDTPKYKVGRFVKFFCAGEWCMGSIADVGGKTGGITDSEFVYDIRIDARFRHGIYESNIQPL